jgi:sugar/nucleoside kinase (ribokinase family)
MQAKELDARVLRDARLVHVDDVDEETSIRAASMAREAGIPVTSDIERATPRTADLIAAVTIPIFAEHVLAELTGEPEPEAALRAMRRRHDGMLCVTLGARGAMLLDGERLYREPGHTVEAVDTTGAGDVFRGALIYALLKGNTPAEMLRFANAAAAISCTRVGAMASVPTVDEATKVAIS